MPRIITRGTRIDARRATTVGLASFATLTLLPLLAHAKPSERAVLLLAATPAAALYGYLAGYAAGSATRLEAAALQTEQVTDRQLRAAQRQASQPSAPVISIVSEPISHPGTSSPVGRGHLAALTRPPADQAAGRTASRHGDGLHLVSAPSRGTPTTPEAAAAAASSGLSGRDPHLTLISTQHPTS